jgi:hypothetical protein
MLLRDIVEAEGWWFNMEEKTPFPPHVNNFIELSLLRVIEGRSPPAPVEFGNASFYCIFVANYPCLVELDGARIVTTCKVPTEFLLKNLDHWSHCQDCFCQPLLV